MIARFQKPTPLSNCLKIKTEAARNPFVSKNNLIPAEKGAERCFIAHLQKL